MNRPFARRGVAAAFVSVVIAALLPAAALAGPPERFTDESTSISCEAPLEADGATAFLFAATSTQFGPFGEIAYWAAGADPAADPPTLVTDFDEPATGSGTTTSISIDVPLEDPETGDPGGTAAIEATLEAAGPAEPFEDRFRFGNHFERFSGTFQPLDVVAGTLTIDGVVFDLADCTGGHSVVEGFLTRPNAFVDHESGIDLFCAWETDIGFVDLFGFSHGDFSFVDLFIFPAEVSGGAEGALSSAGVSAEIPLFDHVSGEPLEQPAVVDATFTPGAEEVELLVFADGRVKSTVQSFDVAGTLTIAEFDLVLDMSACGAREFDSHVIFTQPQGPKPATRLAANDLPAGALPLVPGDRLTARTAATSPAPEVEASCLPADDPFFGPLFGRTLWYSVEGTGGEVTIDAAGSHFDTAIAVYAVDGATLTEVACLDDSPAGETTRTLQTRLTFATDAGTQYLVQVGGFAGEYGLLKLAAL